MGFSLMSIEQKYTYYVFSRQFGYVTAVQGKKTKACLKKQDAQTSFMEQMGRLSKKNAKQQLTRALRAPILGYA